MLESLQRSTWEREQDRLEEEENKTYIQWRKLKRLAKRLKIFFAEGFRDLECGCNNNFVKIADTQAALNDSSSSSCTNQDEQSNESDSFISETPI